MVCVPTRERGNEGEMGSVGKRVKWGAWERGGNLGAWEREWFRSMGTRVDCERGNEG